MAFKWFRKKSEYKSGESAPEAPSSEPEEKAPEMEPEPLPPEPEEKPSADFEEETPAEEEETRDAEASAVPDPGTAEAPKAGGFFGRLKNGLSKTRQLLSTDIEDLFAGGRSIDDTLLEDLEELLITSDIGVQTSMDLIDTISRNPGIKDAEDLKTAIRNEIVKVMAVSEPDATDPIDDGPRVIMIVGVNGVGKTTTIGKLAARSVAEGRKVLIAASDTFRAAAIEQLTIWAERAGADIVKHKDGADPAAVAYDAIEAALARGVDEIYIDTAGRLHTKVNLMEELKKIRRSVGKKIPTAPHEVLLVLDATTGQNALSQAKLFHEAIDLSGLVVTKLDGTAKGGIVISICRELNVPLRYIGVGEGMKDLQRFDPDAFARALF
ncbi:MAG: signal recognition particle-docking protein FtsY [Desulfobacteraceae bacterium]|nr:signal recognition particle-docking protein FtsY [Desulfobacteraceae bacterium]